MKCKHCAYISARKCSGRQPRNSRIQHRQQAAEQSAEAEYRTTRMASQGARVGSQVGAREKVSTAEGPAIVVCMPRDNNCLFTAVSHQLHITGVVQGQLGEVGGVVHLQHAAELRKQAVEFIEKSRDRFTAQAQAMAMDNPAMQSKVAEDPGSTEVFGWFVQQLSRAGVVGGGEEYLTALCNVYGVWCPIRVSGEVRDPRAAAAQPLCVYDPDNGQINATLNHTHAQLNT